MLRRIVLTAALIITAASAWASGNDATRLGYDPGADPFEQYQQAIAQAHAENKLVLIVAGGDWCRWCHVLNRFVTTNTDVEAALRDTFVVVKVYVGDENFNEFFFAQLPEARGAPHFWIVSPERNVLASQSTAAFEHGRNGYDKHEFLQFIAQWRQHPVTPLAAR
ncbi:MAG TPA: thioredoxin family protein [Povalibacter sp.]